MEWNAVITIMVPVVGSAVIGVGIWSVQRIIGRIDKIGDQLVELATRVTVIETKQDVAVTTAAQTAKVARRTAAKVGVRLPRELENTGDPRRPAAARS